MLPRATSSSSSGARAIHQPELLREDQRVVAEPQRVLGDVGRSRASAFADELGTELEAVDADLAVRVDRGDGLHGCSAHRCGTPSDAV